ncbi:hypothetical protein [Paenibacillus odorifer]|uniref:hypothetical protein n=1 Tax=Paenibacillus odorifer TaxID=189426 RepID=UPI00096E2E6A|nr:hypothetical protein [Paenibacillus odorifer]OMD76864.1 hypothetical protein BSK50_14015 [Paenibacillus odorifer]
MKHYKQMLNVTYTSQEVGTNREIEYIKVLSGKVENKKPSFASNDKISEILKEYDLRKPHEIRVF